MQSPGTEYWAERLQFEYWRSLAPHEMAAIVSELNATVHRLSLAGLREIHPTLSEEELELKAAALRVGRDAVLAITGIDPDLLGTDAP
jgi:hypothetical protein